MANFNLATQFMAQNSSATAQNSAVAQSAMQTHGQNEIVQMMKKREKMNNSALAQIETSGSSSRKFASGPGQGGQPGGQGTSNSKMFNKLEPGSAGAQAEGSSRSQQKTRRQLSNTDKAMNWTGQGLNSTGLSNTSNSAQMPSGGSRKQGSSLGGRKTSLEQKFTAHSGFGSSH